MQWRGKPVFIRNRMPAEIEAAKAVPLDELKDPMNPDNRNVFYEQLSEFTLESDRKLHCNLDGEPIHKKKLRFSVLPRHLRVAF